MLTGNKIYNVYMKADAEEPLETTIFVKEGFSLWGFMFHIVWAGYHRLWWVALVYAAFVGALVLTQHYEIFNTVETTVIELGARLIVGFSGYDWVSGRLQKEGYVLQDIVSGVNSDEAERRFFDRYFEEVHTLRHSPVHIPATIG